MTWLERAWLKQAKWLYVFWPLSAVFAVLSALRRWLYRIGMLPQTRLSVPVIVVGNLSVGGNGKTPVVLAIANYLKQQGLRPGIISRGYGGSCKEFPHLVQASDSAEYVGDEPKLLSIASQCPVVIDPIRSRGGQSLVEHCDVLICDDGLQHYALSRDIEIVVMDERGLGNGQLMPTGPLRERSWRLNHVDYILHNTDVPMADGIHMQLKAQTIAPLVQQDITPPAQYDLAIAGIGFPQRFFNTLDALNINHSDTQIFPDHYAYTKEDLDPNLHIIMTEKDAVKCFDFASKKWFYLPVKAEFDGDFLHRLYQDIQAR